MARTAGYIDDLVLLGRRIRETRARRDEISQRTLAKTVGCTAAYISRIEKGERQPSLQTLEVIAEVLGTSTTYLMTGKPSAIERGLETAGVGMHELDERERRMFNHELDDALYRAARDAATAIVAMRDVAIGTA